MTGRTVKLRPVAPWDADRYMAWLTDARLALWHGNESKPEQEFARILTSPYNFMVECNGEVVGATAIEGDWQTRIAAELGVVIDPAHQGQGLGSVAAGLTLDFAFGEGLHRAYHGVYSHNAPVLAFFKRLGFVEEGRFRETHRWGGVWVDEVWLAILDREWAELRASWVPGKRERDSLTE